MQASDLALSAQCLYIEWPCFRRVEAECVIVCTLQASGFNSCIQLRLRQAQWQCLVSICCACFTIIGHIQHGPLVHAEAQQVRLAAGCCRQ